MGVDEAYRRISYMHLSKSQYGPECAGLSDGKYGKGVGETEALILRAKEELQHVRYIATPRFVPSTTEKMMVGIGKVCEKYNLPVQSHLSENRNEIAWVRAAPENQFLYGSI
ncbi:MAG: hypothetical protein ACLTCI_07485 [[Clostridium] nexile]